MGAATGKLEVRAVSTVRSRSRAARRIAAASGCSERVSTAAISAEEDATRTAAIDRLLELQQADFGALFAAMAGLPVTIRVLDPPLHEFLPRPESVEDPRRRDRVLALQEVNPMLGTRGIRLGILHLELYEMQVRAIAQAMLCVGPTCGLPRIVHDLGVLGTGNRSA